MLELSLGWVLQHPAVKTAVCGARTPQQAEEIVEASAARLTLDQILEIDFIVGSNKYESVE